MTKLIFPSAPKPKSSLDSFIGPGATSAEVIFQFSAALLVGLCCLLVYKESSSSPISWQKHLGVFILGLDMAGGIVTNATSSAKRWYHRPGQGFVDHMKFIAIHAMQIGAVAYFSIEKSNLQVQFFAMVFGTLLISSGIVLCVPLYLQRPIAMALIAMVIPLNMLPNLLPPTPGLEWFVPMLFVKLLVSHLVIEMPFQPDDSFGEEIKKLA